MLPEHSLEYPNPAAKGFAVGTLLLNSLSPKLANCFAATNGEDQKRRIGSSRAVGLFLASYMTGSLDMKCLS